MKRFEKKALKAPGAAQRIARIENELRLAVGLTALRERAGLSQRELAQKMGVSQPRVAAIERCQNVTIDVLDQYVSATGGALEVSVVNDGIRSALIAARAPIATKRHQSPTTRIAAKKKVAGRVARAVLSPARRTG